MKIIDYLNDTEVEANIEVIGNAREGYNAPKIVNVNGKKGFRKKSISCPTFDSFEYLISILGKMLNIKTADTYIFNDGSIFSKSVVNDDEELILIEDMAKHVKVTDEEVKEKKYFDSKQKVLYNDKGFNKYLVSSEEGIDFVISIFIRLVKKLKLPDEEEIIKDYIKMCFFDSIIGNKDRTGGNFGLIKNKNGYSFAPLFDSSTVAMKIGELKIDDNLVQLNGYYVDRNSLLSFLIEKYPNYLRDCLSVDIGDVRGRISELSSKVLTPDDKKWFDYMITDNLLSRLYKANMSNRRSAL